MHTLYFIVAIACYLLVAFWLTRALQQGAPMTGAARTRWLLITIAGLVAHTLALAIDLSSGQGLNLALTNAFSLIAWVVVTLFLITALRCPIDNLGVIVLPVSALSLLAEWLWPGMQLLPAGSSLARSSHITVSLLAYSLIILGAAQSLMLLVQEKHLRSKHTGGFMRALPPLQTMEDLMVQMVAVGFFLLTLTVLTGIFFSEAVFGAPLKLNHHILLSVLAWVVFAVFLLGRWRLGWRGRTAVYWVLGGALLLVLGYFGTKFVAEVLLGK